MERDTDAVVWMQPCFESAGAKGTPHAIRPLYKSNMKVRSRLVVGMYSFRFRKQKTKKLMLVRKPGGHVERDRLQSSKFPTFHVWGRRIKSPFCLSYDLQAEYYGEHIPREGG